MKHTTLPNTSVKISKICLGTMTFGNQNSEAESHSQLDYALERGVNFIDTAEMYPIGGNAEIFGSTERHIGSWIKKSGKRDEVVLATKIAGPNRGMTYIRNPLDFSKFVMPMINQVFPELSIKDILSVQPLNLPSDNK